MNHCLRKPITRETVKDMLALHGIIPTRQRVEIARVLFSRQTHFSADQLLDAVHLENSASSKATIYNTLNLFVEKRLVREVIVDPNRVFYDPNMVPHHHIYNMDTGELTDVEADEMMVTGLPQLPQGMVAEYVDVIVRIRSARQASTGGL